MKTIVIGVMPQEQIRARVIAIAKGQYKPKPGEPKIWFTSMKSVAEVLSDQNHALLKVIRESNPDSIAVLAKATGRQPGNLSRTLKAMSRYGLVDPSAATLVRRCDGKKLGRKVRRDNGLRRSMPALIGRCPDRRRCVADGVRDGRGSR